MSGEYSKASFSKSQDIKLSPPNFLKGNLVISISSIFSYTGAVLFVPLIAFEEKIFISKPSLLNLLDSSKTLVQTPQMPAEYGHTSSIFIEETYLIHL